MIQLSETVKRLERKAAAFHDLPRDLTGARAEYKRLERELNSLIQEWDRMLEDRPTAIAGATCGLMM